MYQIEKKHTFMHFIDCQGKCRNMYNTIKAILLPSLSFVHKTFCSAIINIVDLSPKQTKSALKYLSQCPRYGQSAYAVCILLS